MQKRPSNILTTHEISQLLGVSAGATIKWIEKGLLPSFRTPGGHRRVVKEDLLDFLRAQKIPVPPSLVPSPRILVVDDDETILSVFERMFSREEATVKTVNNGVEALIAVGKFDPTVIVLDIEMPGLDGVEVCRRIRAMGLKCAILAISGVNIQENRGRVLESGADAFVAKPWDMAEMKALLESLWKKSRRPSRATPT